MTESIDNPGYWTERLSRALQRQKLHQAIYLVPTEEWEVIAERHRAKLAEEIKPTDSILDAGCAWGRLLDLLPNDWNGDYLGIDLSPDFLNIARENYNGRQFVCGRIEDAPKIIKQKIFDVAVVLSVKQMVITNVGVEAWEKMESVLHKVAKRVLILEYK